MRPKSFTLDGRRYRLDARIPTGNIARRVAREHVGMDDIRIAAIIRDAVTQKTRWTPRLAKQAELFALACHRKKSEAIPRRDIGRPVNKEQAK